MSADCPSDDQRILDELRQVPTPGLGRLLEPLLPAVLQGDASDATRHAAELGAEVLSERKRRAA